MKKLFVIGLLVLLAITLTACTAGPNKLVNTPDDEGRIAGFWDGLWHGIIAPITFVISIFNDNVAVFDIHNNGAWYTFGFLFGFSAFWGGGSSGARRARRKNRD